VGTNNYVSTIRTGECLLDGERIDDHFPGII